ncbi:MAG TPA: hypothetical protein VIL03_00985 [Clostridia bacterium]|jgi:hypothetical protein
MSFKSILLAQKIKNFQKKRPFDENAEFYSLKEGASQNLTNSYYISGHSKDGQSIIIRLGERGTGNNEVWFAYHDLLDNNFICAHQILENQSLIETSCLQAGKKWKIQYSGGIIQDNKTPQNIWKNLKGTRIIPAVFDGEFTAVSDIYDFCKHSDARVIARALSSRKIDKKKIQDILNLVYYEQAGKLQGSLNLGGKKTEIDMTAIRRRMYGERDLNNIKRHFSLNILTEKGQTVSVHLLETVFGNFQIGYYTSDKGNISLDSVIIDEMPTYIPNSFKLLASFTDDKKLVIKCEKETEFEFSYDDDNYRIIESIARFDINGAKARGIIRLGYNILLNK